jgi:hypothetical protein
MRTREILKILKSLSVEGRDKILLDLIMEDFERDEKVSTYLAIGVLLILCGSALGWLAFGYLPTIRR